MFRYRQVQQPPGWLILRLLISLICLIILLNQVISVRLTSSQDHSSNNSSSNASILAEALEVDKAQENPSIVANSTSTLAQLASTLEPIYFGKYPKSRLYQQPPPFHSTHLDEHEHELQGDFYASNENSPLISPMGSYYYVKDDTFRRPKYVDTTEEQGDNPVHHDDIVTLHAFGGREGSQRVAATSNANSDFRDELNSGSRELNLNLLRQLPAEKQVELVKKALLLKAMQRPALNLVSGTFNPGQTKPKQYNTAPAYNESLRDYSNMLNKQRHRQQRLAGEHYSPLVIPITNSQELQPITHPEGIVTVDTSEEENEDPDSIQQQIQRLFTGNQADKVDRTTSEKDQHLKQTLLDALRKGQNEATMKSSQEEKGVSSPKSVPIEKLVDHLMANSRLSTFGIQHENLLLPEDEEVLGEDEEEEEEEEPEENEAAEDAQESIVIENKALASSNNSGFSTMLNKSNSWIPLDNLDKAISLDKIGPKKATSSVEFSDDKKQVSNSKKLEGKSRKKKEKKAKKNKKKRKRKKGKKKKKKKKKKRDKRSGLGLVVGGKVLTRDDLIRLIGILNKMSKKGETEKEREESKKLLRYIIKLMLTDRKKNDQRDLESKYLDEIKKAEETSDKATKRNTGVKRVNSIRDLLRPLIEGPKKDGAELSKDEKNSAENEKEDNLIELSPLFEEQNEKLKEKKVRSESNQSDTEDKAYENKRKAEDPGEKVRKKVGLSELSDDLEQYFDTDFYEDMADKMDDQNKTHIGSASGTRIMRVAAKSDRRPRLVYTVPVPIYGQQLFEAADEDDTDFDSVPIPRRALSDSRTSRQRAGRKRQLGRRRKQRVVENDERKQDQEPEEVEDVEEEEEEPDESEDDKEPPVASSEEQSQEESPIQEAKEQAKQNNREKEQASKDTGVDEQDVSKQDLSSVRPGKKLTNNDTKSNKINKQKRKRRRRKRRKHPEGNFEVDYDSRYEIPAPIVAGKTAVEMRLPNNSTNKLTNSKAKPSALANKKANNKLLATIDVSSRNPHSSPRTNPVRTNQHDNYTSTANKKRRSSRASLNRTHKDIGKKQKHEVKTRGNHEEPVYAESKPDDEEDDDYYNEGTSYSKICDDDGKCKVSVSSSNPKLEKALKSKNKTNIARHLNPWIAQD